MRAHKRKDYHHGSLRRALTDAAVKVIAKRGVDALNLRELVVRVGVTPGAPYHHFPNRQRLLAAIAEEGFAKFEAELIAARDATLAEAGARLEALGQAYIRFATANPGYFRVMFHGEANASGPTGPGLRAFHLLADAVIDCQRGGAAPAGDPTLLVLTAWSAVHGFATLWIDRALPFEGIEPGPLAPEFGLILTRMFSALARDSSRERADL